MATKKKPTKAESFQMAAVADAHVHNFARYGGASVKGLNDRGRESIAALERALKTAEAAGCTAFFIAGDLTHVGRPEPAILAELQRVIDGADIKTIIVPGNHDCLDVSAEGGNTSCAPLQDYATVVLVPTLFQVSSDLRVLAVPFDGRRSMAQHLEEVVPRMFPKGGPGPSDTSELVLVTHVGVYDGASAPPWMRKAKDAIEVQRLQDLMDLCGISLALVGNYHEPRRWDTPLTRIVQVGTLCPHSFSDPPDAGGVALVRPGTVEVRHVPGPRFETVHGAEGLRAWKPRAESGYVHYVRVKAPEQPDPKLRQPEMRVLEWYPTKAAEERSPEAQARPVQTPEELLARAPAGAPEDIRENVRDLLTRAWKEGAA